MATMNAPTMDRRTTGERRVSMRPHTRSAMSALDYLAMALLIIGGLNWGMVGLFDVDMVATLFGPGCCARRLSTSCGAAPISFTRATSSRPIPSTRLPGLRL